MSQLTLHQFYSGASANLIVNCDLYKHYLWNCVDPLILPDFTLHCVMVTKHLPLDAKDKSTFKEIDLAFKNYLEYNKSMEKLRAPIVEKEKVDSSKPRIVNSISSSGNSSKPNGSSRSSTRNAICGHCEKPGHTESQCFTLHPELTFCKKCRKLGHYASECPS